MYKTHRALKALSQCSQALVRARDEKELLDEICRIIVETAGYRLVWVGYAEQDEGKTVRPVAQAGFEAGYLETVNVTWADTERGRGPVGTSVRTGRPSIIKDTLSDARFAPWREEAARRGYASCAGLPLLADGTAFGSLAIYAPEPTAFEGQELALLTELADNLAYGITALRIRAERDRVEQALQQSYTELEARVERRTAELAKLNAQLRDEIAHRLRAEAAIEESRRRYRTLFEDSPLSLWEEDFSQVKAYLDNLRASGVSDYRGHFTAHPEAVAACAELVRVQDVNKATLALLGARSKEELLRNLPSFFAGNALDVFREELVTLAEGKLDFEAESTHTTSAGEKIEVALYLAVVPGYEDSFAEVLVSMLDITGRKQAEELARRERAMLRQMLDVYEKHRQMVAYDIHDGVAQSLSGALMSLEGAIERLRQQSVGPWDELERIGQTLRDGLAEARRLMRGLRPPVLDEAGLVPAIENLIHEARGEGREEIEYAADIHFGRLASPLETAIFRIVQEGLTNARRYSGSGRIRVGLVQQDSRLRIEIEDWGTGFDPTQVAEKHFGLKGIRQRAELFDGHAEIRTAPGQGTCITVELPLVAAASEDDD